jgi:hypothetical protein
MWVSWFKKKCFRKRFTCTQWRQVTVNCAKQQIIQCWQVLCYGLTYSSRGPLAQQKEKKIACWKTQQYDNLAWVLLHFSKYWGLYFKISCIKQNSTSVVLFWFKKIELLSLVRFFKSQFLFLIYTIAVYYRSITNLRIWSDFMNVTFVCFLNDLQKSYDDLVYWKIILQFWLKLTQHYDETNWPVSDLLSNFLILLYYYYYLIILILKTG